MKIEEQTERIVSLEEEVVTLCWKKACTCGEKKRNVSTQFFGLFQNFYSPYSNPPYTQLPLLRPYDL